MACVEVNLLPSLSETTLMGKYLTEHSVRGKRQTEFYRHPCHLLKKVKEKKWIKRLILQN